MMMYELKEEVCGGATLQSLKTMTYKLKAVAGTPLRQSRKQ